MRFALMTQFPHWTFLTVLIANGKLASSLCTPDLEILDGSPILNSSAIRGWLLGVQGIPVSNAVLLPPRQAGCDYPRIHQEEGRPSTRAGENARVRHLARIRGETRVGKQKPEDEMTQPRSTFEQFIGIPGNDRIYEQERLLVEATELIANAMETTQMKRGELARRLGRSKAYVTQILSGNRNLTLRTVADVCWALNCRVVMQSQPLAATECGAVALGQWDLIQQTGKSTVNADRCSEDRRLAWAA
jgi:DNA-binding phage protein